MRTQTFKDYVLSRANKRENPYNLSRIEDVVHYCKGIPYDWEEESDFDLMGSSWDWSDIVVRAQDCIVPAEVIHSKLCKALFL